MIGKVLAGGTASVSEVPDSLRNKWVDKEAQRFFFNCVDLPTPYDGAASEEAKTEALR